jgi:hypothetical protein
MRHERTPHARGRLKAVVASAALAVVALGAVAGAGAKIDNGVHVWLSGGRRAAEFRSAMLVHWPMAADLRAVAAHATFPVVFPAGIPGGSRTDLLTVAPLDRPSYIVVFFHHGARFKAGLALFDPAVVSTGALPKAATQLGVRAGTIWRQGGEIIAVPSFVSAADVARIKAATARLSPAQSLAAIEAAAPTLRVIGVTVRLDIAERYARSDGRSVLVGDQYLPTVLRLASGSKPLLDNRIARLSNVRPVNKRIIRSTNEPITTIAVPAPGVRAIAAVLRAPENRAGCRCEIVFDPLDGGTYQIRKIPLAPSGKVTKYVVDASTLAVRAER